MSMRFRRNGGGKYAQIPREIGSNFWISKEQFETIDNNKCDNINRWNASYLSTCRSAIGEVLKRLKDSKTKKALLPAFTCHSVLLPFIENGYEVFPYSIKEDLTVDWEKFMTSVEEIHPDVVLLHSYFGFNTISGGENVIKQLRKQGVSIIEDLTQRLYSTFEGIGADYQVGSLRKWMPIPDGAVLMGLNMEQPTNEDKELSDAKMKAMFHKGEYLMKGKGDKQQFRTEYAEAEHILDSRTVTYCMSDASRRIINSTDLDEMADLRRDNYKRLALRLKEFAAIEMICPELPDDVVPFMMPVLVKNGRKELQQFMASHDIYPTVIWACPNEFKDKIDSTARMIYDNILCFHIDQRYTYAEMERIGNILEKYYKNNYYE